MKSIKSHVFLFTLLVCSISFAQQTDSSAAIQLDPVQVSEHFRKNEMERLPEVQGTLIFSGKKNEVITPGNMDADLSTNNTRQIFAKVPGITIWENDGSGMQVGIAARGLSPNRSWEFNVRQNYCDISSEVYGYPEAYFSPPMEAVEKIELVRGAASLQFGPQFGGLLNYEIKKGVADKPIVFETKQTLGSYGLFNSYNAIGGTIKKLSYYVYFHQRSADGWRENSRYRTNTAYAGLNYAVTPRLNISLQYTRMNYYSQQPGGLTDSLFAGDARASSRERNWFSTPWNVSAFTLEYKFNEGTRMSIKAFSTIAERNSVGFIKAINIADTFNTTLNSYNPRQVDRDAYNNLGTEIRFTTAYTLLKQKSTLAAGVRVYKGVTVRRQAGTGTSGSDFDLSLTSGAYGKDLTFSTENYATFAENIFKIGSRLSVTPGVRYEIINSIAEGYINTSSTGAIKEQMQKRNVLLFGLGAEFKTSSTTAIYANVSQSYRPVTYSELTPSGTTEVIDPDLKDAGGYNADLGFRGKLKDYLFFDAGVFYLKYDNRIGVITQNNLPYKTNIGASESKGVECFTEVDPVRFFNDKPKAGTVRLFVSYSFVDAKYISWNNPAIENDPVKSIKGKRLEYAPQNSLRWGLTYRYKTFSAALQFSKIDAVYTDAVNTEKPNAAATTGKLPAYQVADVSCTYLLRGKYNLSAGVNNLLDEKYATRRAGGYPGPGLMPANGRTFYISVGGKF